MHPKSLFGIAAAALSLLCYVPYVRSVMAGVTRPHGFSWVIWAILTALACAIQVVKGAGAGAWLSGLSALFCALIAGLAFARGEHGATRFDRIAFVAGLAAIPLWALTKDPLWSLLLVMGIEGSAFWLTLKRAWMKPFEEMGLPYLVYAASVALALLAMQRYNFTTVAYPVFILLSNAAVFVVVGARRRVLAA